VAWRDGRGQLYQSRASLVANCVSEKIGRAFLRHAEREARNIGPSSKRYGGADGQLWRVCRMIDRSRRRVAAPGVHTVTGNLVVEKGDFAMALWGKVNGDDWTAAAETRHIFGGFECTIHVNHRGSDGALFDHAFKHSRTFETEREAVLEGLREGMVWINLKISKTIGL
jgi:hypothetical protein